ncbi:MAG: S9 family peptidase [Blastocatellia bacterium]|nr:S9 family peptidase [Blastocatellia bacterium]MCS7157504.1 S9 family peptidase [Blastocatellia bacterium]MDW8255604.1 S9 family peptidase [Acidobacteriota bacterium]
MRAASSRRFPRRAILAITLSLLCALPLRAAASKRPFTFDDLMAIWRLSDPQVSPDGRWVAFTVTTMDKAKNARYTDIWVIPTTGGELRQLTTHPATDMRPRWAPDGRRLAFISTRDGTPQIWTMDVTGGEPQPLTRFPTGASGVLWSPDGRHLAFTAEVYPDCPDEACNRRREEERARSQVKARIYTRLLYRHWDTWKDGKRRHLFVIPATGGPARDLTPGDHDVPPFALGGPDDYAFSPDGNELCFVRKDSHDEAISTNSDLWIVPLRGGEPRRLTTNPAADNSPLYSPDGRYIAYRAQERPGFESDRWRLMLYDRQTGRTRSLTDALDHWVEEFVWAPDSQRLYFTVAEGAAFPIYAVTIATGEIQKLVPTGTNEGLQITPDGKTLVFLRHSFSQPAELHRVNVDGSQLTPLTRMNAERLAQIQWGDVRSIWYTGAAGARVQGWIITPPGFDPSRKYPMIVLLHGGPQSVWADLFHYRWNAQLFAAAGYVIFLPNPRGSIGFGQKFIDEISGDWGGKVYEDVMRGVDYVVNLGFVDPNRIGAAGGSYGGYLVNWIAGQTDRFRALVSHAGVFNLISMYGSTEELWFPEWEFRGTPWTNKELYERWSPHNFAQNFKTPTLVIHGELDFRVPLSEGLQMFTALQRQNVPSKLVVFPDEGHWILKPQNSELWYRTVIEWFDRYLKAPGS